MIYSWVLFFFFFQAEDGIRDLVRSRGLGDVYKRQVDRPIHISYNYLYENKKEIIEMRLTESGRVIPKKWTSKK